MQDSLFADDRALTVAQLTDQLTAALRTKFRKELWVEGEARNVSRSAAGHVYFNLVEPTPAGRNPTASISVVLFNGERERVNAKIKSNGGGVRVSDGVQLRIRAAVDFYAPQGSLQLRMTDIDPAYTLGQLAADRDRILLALKQEGLLEANAKHETPALPLTIALVASVGSAGYVDFVQELAASGIAFQLLVADTRVQGEGADLLIRNALRRADRPGVDLIAVIRGGGARTDLATFDSEIVARAIAERSRPVVVGVGHEIDRSIADDVASHSCKTPTACATHIIALVAHFSARMETAWSGVVHEATEQINQDHDRLSQLANRTARATQQRVVAAERQTTRAAERAVAGARRQLDRSGSGVERNQNRVVSTAKQRLAMERLTVTNHHTRLQREAPRPITAERRRIDALAAQVRALDPTIAMARGWSITRSTNGAVLKSVTDASPGDTLTTTLADGTVTSTVAAATGSVDETSKDPR